MPEELPGQGDGGTGTLGANTPGGAPSAPPKPTGDLDWRARALKAEARAQELEKLAAELAQKLELAQSSAAAAERKRQIEKALTDTGAIDIETASMLLESALGASKSTDLTGAVSDLRRRKPFLFGAGTRASAMSGSPGTLVPDSLSAAADEARTTGNRNALLRYLRMKRD